MRLLRVAIFLFLTIWCSFSAFCDGPKIRILFIGNSLTFYNDLPEVIKEMARMRKHDIEYDIYAPDGYCLAQHSNDAVLREKIKNGPWDFVVLQEKGGALASSQAVIDSYVAPFAATLCQAIRNASPNAKIVFYVTAICKGMSLDIQNVINANHVLLARSNQATLAPVGQAWAEAIERFPDIEMYAPDGIHPSINGTYLTACVFCSVFFHETATGLPRAKDISRETALSFQALADKAMTASY